MRRRRNVPRRGSSRSLRPTVVLVIVLAVGLVAMPAGSVTLGTFDRASVNDVVTDPDGVIGLDVAASVRKNNVDPLVNVTNNLGTDASVVVTLQDGADGDLNVDGVNHGAQATLTVAAGGMRTVDIEAAADPGATIEFDVDATADGVEFSASNRATTVDPPGGGGGPPGGGPP